MGGQIGDGVRKRFKHDVLSALDRQRTAMHMVTLTIIQLRAIIAEVQDNAVKGRL